MNKQEELVHRCKQGDPAAYTTLYNDHAAAVYNSIVRLLVHTGEAEDILQESFVAAFDGISKFNNTVGFRPWVKRIAINKAIDLIRKRKLRLVELEPVWMDDTIGEEEVIDETEIEYTIDKISKAVEALPENYRTIFNLVAVENIPQTEIAQMLGIESGTVRIQFYRAKQKILQTLSKGGRHDERIGEIYRS
jgi:RNA polymerase sigma factor (sigma-70 family)